MLLGYVALRLMRGEPTRESHRRKTSTLLSLFSKLELESIIKDMKTHTAPGLDGFPISLFHKCWPLVKHGVLHILNDFIMGRIDFVKLNFSVLSLIPKVPRADRISQFRHITLINW
jgi:hypothetical protein